MFSSEDVHGLGRACKAALFQYCKFVEVLRELPDELSRGKIAQRSSWQEADEAFRILVEASMQLHQYPIDGLIWKTLQTVKPAEAAYIVRASRSVRGHGNQEFLRFGSIHCAINSAIHLFETFQPQLERLITQLKPPKNADEWRSLARQLIEIGSEDLISLTWDDPESFENVAAFRLDAESEWLLELVNGNSSAICDVSPDNELIPDYKRGDQARTETAYLVRFLSGANSSESAPRSFDELIKSVGTKPKPDWCSDYFTVAELTQMRKAVKLPHSSTHMTREIKNEIANGRIQREGNKPMRLRMDLYKEWSTQLE